MLPYLVVFLPGLAFYLRHRSVAAARKKKFELDQVPDDEVFHRCAKCGKTEQSDPEAEFVVEDDDEEYCTDCLDSSVQPQT